MIHSLSGGVITSYENLIYAFVQLTEGLNTGAKRWYISPFPKIKVGDKVLVPCGANHRLEKGVVLRLENVTAQTAPFPVNRTAEIDAIISD